MKALSIDELVQLPEPLAFHRHLDARNYRVFRWLLALGIILMLVGIGNSLSHRHLGLAAILAADLAATVVLVMLRRERFYSVYFRQILLGFLIAQLVILKVLSLGTEDPTAFFIPFTFALIVFRLRLLEHLMSYLALLGLAMLPLDASGLPSAAAFPDGGAVAGVSIVGLMCLALAVALTQVEKRRFLVIWRTEHARARERMRMREEIEYARKIQLSMLPQLPPDIAWVELAAASLPATEVGGDYYDYFRLSPTQLALVVGDVSGHGLASGLLLSGVRSCLYLLETELAAPVEVLERLHQMVRKTTDRRTYVTLLLAVLDHAPEGGGTLTVASAGHPPVLCYRAHSGLFEEMGEGSTPLGTGLEGAYQQQRKQLEPGDLLVLYTDGLVESRNALGQDYGYDRLQRTVGRAAVQSPPVREIRDAVLGDLSHFKGDSEQADDITLVVARIR